MILIANGTVLTMGKSNQVIQDGGVLIQDSKILEVGSTQDLQKRFPDAEFIDARGKLIMPGMINTHMHLYSTFARGMDSKSKPPKNFGDILEGLWWKLDKLLTLDDVYYSGLTPLIECIKTGTTTIVDHHASPMAITGSLSTLAKAAKELGVRAAFVTKSRTEMEMRLLKRELKKMSTLLPSVRLSQIPWSPECSGSMLL